jgi:23S rRNA U2552 (ribose-2'-O)-methylase RlmE/FtsJ
VFDGDMVGDLERELAASFAHVRRTKPPASREPSSELYLIGVGFRPGTTVPRPSDAAFAPRPGPAI